MKKIGILTYTSNFNMGSFWQAYATLELLRSSFSDYHVEIINYHRKLIRSQVKFEKWLVPGKWHLHPVYLCNDIIRRKKFRKFQKQYLCFDAAKGFYCDDIKLATEFLNQQGYDCIFVGSDTVLEFNGGHYRDEVLPVYWLSKNVHGEKFLTAASVDTRPPDFSKLSLSLQKQLKESLKGFQLLGVRDNLTYETIYKIAENCADRLCMVPDPTFSLDIDFKPAENYLKKKGLDLKVPIIGIDLPLTLPGFKECVEAFRNKGYQLVQWRHRPYKGCINCMDMDPVVWAGIFRFLTLTITNRFHASVFCLKNLVPVLSVDFQRGRYLANGWSKNYDLLERFGMAETNYKRIDDLTNTTDFTRAVNQAIKDFDRLKVKQTLEVMKNEINSYITSVSKIL